MAKTHPRYENADFGEWSFNEFPLMLYPGAPDPTKPVYETEGKNRGKLKFAGVIAEDEDEAKRIIAGAQTVKPDDGGPARLETAEDALEAKQREATDMGVQFDKRWSLARLQDAIDTKRAEAVV